MTKHEVRRVFSPSLRQTDRTITGSMLWVYSLLFAVFFAVVFSPFWFYGKSFLWSSDGTSQHLTGRLYVKRWFGTIVQNLHNE